MDILRDPVWQFVGVLIAALSAGGSAILWMIQKNQKGKVSSEDEIIERLKQHMPLGNISPSGKHKKRKDDGILLANLSSDFLNQFPVRMGVLAAQLDCLYTPENFGSSDWLGVFRRLSSEGYFVPVGGQSPERITVESQLDAGPKMQTWIRLSIESKRRIAGLDD